MGGVQGKRWGHHISERLSPITFHMALFLWATFPFSQTEMPALFLITLQSTTFNIHHKYDVCEVCHGITSFYSWGIEAQRCYIIFPASRQWKQDLNAGSLVPEFVFCIPTAQKRNSSLLLLFTVYTGRVNLWGTNRNLPPRELYELLFKDQILKPWSTDLATCIFKQVP